MIALFASYKTEEMEGHEVPEDVVQVEFDREEETPKIEGYQLVRLWEASDAEEF